MLRKKHWASNNFNAFRDFEFLVCTCNSSSCASLFVSREYSLKLAKHYYWMITECNQYNEAADIGGVDVSSCGY